MSCLVKHSALTSWQVAPSIVPFFFCKFFKEITVETHLDSCLLSQITRFFTLPSPVGKNPTWSAIFILIEKLLFILKSREGISRVVTLCKKGGDTQTLIDMPENEHCVWKLGHGITWLCLVTFRKYLFQTLYFLMNCWDWIITFSANF